jgi:lipopolysaccharide transport system ATP-binding protein
MPPAIRVESLSKMYRVHRAARGVREGYRTLREDLANLARAPWRQAKKFLGAAGSGADGSLAEEFWALKDVSFDVEQGDVVGIIGRNGAGKSTLLKILSRITPPTSGRVAIRGRIGTLLEVGTGFHPELSGRENIFMNGSILGMSRREIARQFDEIVDFSGVERFLDTPVKRYSSGMQVRLAFAVAAHLNPEILIVDEVLAVGDTDFQHKCLGKMESLSRSGRTVLFVSHNLAALESLCTHGVLLEQGAVKLTGRCCDVIAQYIRGAITTTRKAIASGSTRHIRAVDLKGGDGHPRDRFRVGEDIIFEVELESAKLLAGPVCGLAIHSPRGDRLATLNTKFQQSAKWPFQGTKRLRAVWRQVPLNVGRYRLDVNLWNEGRELENLVGYRTLEIEPGDVYGTGALPDPAFQGYLVPAAEWHTDLAASPT